MCAVHLDEKRLQILSDILGLLGSLLLTYQLRTRQSLKYHDSLARGTFFKTPSITLIRSLHFFESNASG